MGLPIQHAHQAGDPQQAGSAITYARRYQISAMLNIAQEDDDGNASSQPLQKPVTIQTKKPEITLRQINLEEIQKIVALKKLTDEQVKKIREMAGRFDASEALQEAQIMLEEWNLSNAGN